MRSYSISCLFMIIVLPLQVFAVKGSSVVKNILPTPTYFETSSARFSINKEMIIAVSQDCAESGAYLKERLAQYIKVEINEYDSGDIILSTEIAPDMLGKEGYLLKISEDQIHITANNNEPFFLYFPTILPTLCEVAGAEIPENIDGKSFLSLLHGKETEKHEFLYWELPMKIYGGQQAVRYGDWKGIRQNIYRGEMGIELYNLERDAQEQNNIADEFPEIVNKMEEILNDQHQISQVHSFPPVDILKIRL